MKLGYLINPKGQSRTVEIPRDLDGYYKLLDCDTIDIVSRRIGGRYCDIVCDDEGLLKDEIMVSAINSNGEPMLVGSLLICNHDGHGNEASLTQDDIQNIDANMLESVVKVEY